MRGKVARMLRKKAGEERVFKRFNRSRVIPMEHREVYRKLKKLWTRGDSLSL